MYRIAICDDEPIFVKQLSEMTTEFFSEQGEACEIHQFFSADTLKAVLDETPNAFDILLLDIILGTMNGVKFTEYLRDTGSLTPVIFVSSSKDYILAAYSAEPVGYVMKPIDKAKLCEALKRAIRKLKPAAVMIDAPSATLSFNVQDLMYIEVFGKTLLLHMQDRTVTEISRSLSSVAKILPPERFVQCHRSYIVSLSAILSIKRFEITLKNHIKIPVSKHCYNSVQERLQQYAAQWF